MQKKLQKVIAELKKSIEKMDNEAVHVDYDVVIRMIAQQHQPELVAELDEMVKDISFWYA